MLLVLCGYTQLWCMCSSKPQVFLGCRAGCAFACSGRIEAWVGCSPCPSTHKGCLWRLIGSPESYAQLSGIVCLF